MVTASARTTELTWQLARARARDVAAAVPDPELPMLTLGDLGILREVTADGGRRRGLDHAHLLRLPALREMSRDVAARLAAAGLGDVQVRTALSPPWSTDWITPAGRRKLAAAGIAPPGPAPKPRRRPGAAHADRRPGRRGLPGLRLGRHRAHRRVRRHRLPGPVPLPGLREPFEHVKEI